MKHDPYVLYSYACEEHFALAREALVARQNPASHNLTCRGSLGGGVGRYLGGCVGWYAGRVA